MLQARASTSRLRRPGAHGRAPRPGASGGAAPDDGVEDEDFNPFDPPHAEVVRHKPGRLTGDRRGDLNGVRGAQTVFGTKLRGPVRDAQREWHPSTLSQLPS